jgi:hypothetical protein
MHALNEHMEKTFICDLCGEGFVTERSLHNHTSYHHLKAEKICMMQNTLEKSVRLKIIQQMHLAAFYSVLRPSSLLVVYGVPIPPFYVFCFPSDSSLTQSA